ncbi:MAG TPA: hypothetical protein VH374_10900 [Polyangia bacterium]|jgi:hypothetical protein|nr:hypothetical protein [Polyangia bacterium]
MRFLGDSGKWGWVVVFTLVGCCWSTAALAAKGRVGVLFSGSQAGPARGAIVHVLEQHNFSVVKDEQIEAAASKLHRGLDSAGDLAAVATKLKLTAVVAGEVKEGAHKAGAVVRSSNSGKVTAKALWSVEGGPKKLAEAIKASAWARLGPGLRAGAGGGGGGAGSHQSDAAEKLVAAAEHDDEDDAGTDETEKAAPGPRGVVAEEPPAEKPAPATHNGKSDADLEEEAGISSSSDHREKETTHARHTTHAADGDEAVVVARPGRARSSSEQNSKLALELGAGPRLLWRDLHYSAATGSALVPFSMAGAPTLGASGAWYPAAHTTSGPASNIGVTGNIEYASGITSKASDGSTFPTATTDFFGGLRVRLPDGPVQLELTGGYGRHAFVFHNGAQTSRANINVPDVDNRYLRAAADVRLAFTSDLSLTLGAGYRNVIGVGGARYQLKSTQYFPNASVWGMDATAMVGYRFLSVMEAQVGYDLRRYSYTTHAGAGDPIALPNFIDGYSAFWLNLAVVIDGAGSHSKKRSHAEEDDEG